MGSLDLEFFIDIFDGAVLLISIAVDWWLNYFKIKDSLETLFHPLWNSKFNRTSFILMFTLPFISKFDFIFYYDISAIFFPMFIGIITLFI